LITGTMCIKYIYIYKKKIFTIVLGLESRVVTLTKRIGLAQFGFIELQLWVTNRDWVMTDSNA
jgi:hypothetical protein